MRAIQATIHNDGTTPIPAIDADIANGAVADVKCFADVHHPSRLPQPALPDSSKGSVPATVLVRPDTSPVRRANRIAPAIHGEVGSRIIRPAESKRAAITGNQVCESPHPNRRFMKRLAMISIAFVFRPR